MNAEWLKRLKVNPIPALLEWKDPALTFYTRRDLLEEKMGSAVFLQELPDAVKLVKSQEEDGSWRYPGENSRHDPNANYRLVETYRNLRLLVEMYSFTREHACMQKAAEYVFSCQTEEGDIRGILGNQYMPYYHGAMLELLIKAGYEDDPRVIKGLEWLLSMRQDDGGWLVPAQQVPPAWKKNREFWNGPALPPERGLPHAHNATGMVLRAFAAHPVWRKKPEAINAGLRLKERLFKSDLYNDRKTPEYWLKFQYPAWWLNLVNALDTLYALGFDREDKEIQKGLKWFRTHQSPDGLWETGYGNGKKAQSNRAWVGLAICRVLKNFENR